MKITAQFFASGYADPQGDDVEHFKSFKDAKDALWRRSDFDPYYPCVGDDATMRLWVGTLDDVTDVYPDFELTIGPRGGIRKAPA